MPDLTPNLLPDLASHRLPGLDLGEGFQFPAYTGRSILNLPDNICRWLDVPPLGSGPLAEDLVSPLGNGFRSVVLLLLDALGLGQLRRWIGDGSAPQLGELAEIGLLAPLTSITPSTTSAALTTLWTGRAAASHGVAGYELWLKEYGLVANSILHAPMSFKGDVGSLERAGFKPEVFMNLPTLGAHLARQGVQTFSFQHQSIARSGLSRMLFHQVTTEAFRTPSELWVNARRALESCADGGKSYFWIYWGEIDHLSHFYGPDDERVRGELADFTEALRRHFLEPLDPAARRETLFILLADHGQIATQPDPHYDLRNHPGLARSLHILPTGENRLAYLYIKPGQQEAVREYIQRTWPNQFVTLDPVYAVEAGLFGPGEPHPRLLERLGDLVVAARGNAYLWWSAAEDHLFGRHGGLSPEEMLVPFLAVKL
jgi:Type I phosphodiesterase / nucleotide pyrophosphatase